MPIGSTRPRDLRALTGLRFFAAFGVVLFHFGIAYLVGAPAWTLRIVAWGRVGVSLFFILSGFILAYNYMPRQGEVVPKRRFWVARFARIYPVYLLSIVLVAFPLSMKAATSGYAPSGSLGEWLASVLLLQAWWPSFTLGVNPPTWSLSAEVIFYAFFPFLVPLLLRIRDARLVVWLGGVWFVSAIAPLAVLAAYHADPTRALDDISTYLVYSGLARLPEFVIGILLCRLFLASSGKVSPGITAGLAVSGAIAALAIMSVGNSIPFLIMDQVALTPAFAAMIFGLAHASGWLARLLSTRPVVLLGESSYALYLLHVPIFWSLEVIVPVGARFTRTFFVMYVGLAIGLSIIVFRMFEEPARVRIRKALDPQRGAPRAGTENVPIADGTQG